MRIVFSCVCDTKPPYPTQARGLVATLIRLGGVAPSEIIVHLVNEPDPGFVGDLHRAGVVTRIVERVSAEVPTLNKLSQLCSAELQAADVVVLCDCDLAFAGDVRAAVSTTSIRGRPAGYAHPTIGGWRRLLDEAKLDMPPTIRCAVESADTLYQYLNGGILMVPHCIMAELPREWMKWTAWIAERVDLLEGRSRIADQVGFTLACIANRYPIDHLSVAYNYPAELKGGLIGAPKPLVLHYHAAVDADGKIKPPGHPDVDEAVSHVNPLLGDLALAPLGLDGNASAVPVCPWPS